MHNGHCGMAVSYTHLDVYKRQAYTDETYRAYLKEELIKFGFLTKEELEKIGRAHV